MSAAYVVINLGSIEEVDCFATIGPFKSRRAATKAASDLESEFPGGVAYIHRHPHGCVSVAAVADQIARARVKLAECRVAQQGGAA